MGIEFFAIVVFGYKVLAFFVLIAVALAAIFFPLFISIEEDSPLPLAFYLITPPIVAMCLKLMSLIH